MKKAFFWLLGIFLIGCSSFMLGKAYHRFQNRLVSNEISNIENRFVPANFPLHHRSFVFFISAFNNGAFLEKTLRSISSQVYDKYRLIYIDDASTDGSVELASEWIRQSPLALRTILIRNEQKLGRIANLSKVVQMCQDQEIVVVVHGEDWLAHEWVLCRLNQYYEDRDLWITYGQYLEFPSYKKGLARSYQQSELTTLRQVPFVATHLQTFYAALFKRINEADLQLPVCTLSDGADLAFMLPMLEMASSHHQCIDEIHYIVNQQTISHENREQKIESERSIRSIQPYLPIKLFDEERPQEES